jgi:hypothetical protein
VGCVNPVRLEIAVEAVLPTGLSAALLGIQTRRDIQTRIDKERPPRYRDTAADRVGVPIDLTLDLNQRRNASRARWQSGRFRANRIYAPNRAGHAHRAGLNDRESASSHRDPAVNLLGTVRKVGPSGTHPTSPLIEQGSRCGCPVPAPLL